MVQLPGLVWLLVAMIAAIACIGALYALAARVRDEMALREVRERAAVLRANYLRYLESLHSGDGADVDIIDSAPTGVDIIGDAPVGVDIVDEPPAQVEAVPATPARAAA